MINHKNLIITLLMTILIGLTTACKQESQEGADNNRVRTNASKQAPEQLSAELRTSHESFSLKVDEKLNESKIAWVPFNEGIAKAKKENKYIFIDFYAEWCVYCKQLDSETYSNEKIADFINTKFVPIKVDTDSQKLVTFQGTQMTEQQLSVNFGVSSLPTLFFMESEEEALGSIPGYVEPERFFAIASYIGTDAYKTKKFDEFKSELIQKI